MRRFGQFIAPFCPNWRIGPRSTRSTPCTGSPYGYAYTGIDLSLSTNSPTNTDFTQKYTVTGVPMCDD